ncbi:hypothetical protein CWATWH0005_4024 [Crocosphaera watsonii WH 0005]|uniref:Uncharacterized protein n=1 Tax=Crocosphaera watsonii WH 0005 TaxID=423472 RepID=T2IYQ4_CROWT|nr:hypothetical protein CWATWH0005_4024 [Crocosphaera watsonii WH 0005]
MLRSLIKNRSATVSGQVNLSTVSINTNVHQRTIRYSPRSS